MNPQITQISQILLVSALRFCGICAICGSLFAQAPTAKAVRMPQPIRLDGRLDEPTWRLAQPIGPLIQRDPREGEPATEETEVRILYDDQALYFGILCRDRAPKAIVSTQLTRDANLEVDDRVIVVLDAFFNQRSGFFFEIGRAHV